MSSSLDYDFWLQTMQCRVETYLVRDSVDLHDTFHIVLIVDLNVI